jgi:hypothetical protein
MKCLKLTGGTKLIMKKSKDQYSKIIYLMSSTITIAINENNNTLILITIFTKLYEFNSKRFG